jgi:hypothetical protein
VQRLQRRGHERRLRLRQRGVAGGHAFGGARLAGVQNVLEQREMFTDTF